MPIQDFRLYTHTPLTNDQIQQLAGRGLRIVSRLPDGSYRVRGESTTTASDLVAVDFVDTAVLYDPMDKLDASLGALSTLTTAAVADNASAAPVSVLVSLDPSVDPAATTAQLADLGDVVEATTRRVLVRTSADHLAAVAGLDGVLHAEIEPDPHTQN